MNMRSVRFLGTDGRIVGRIFSVMDLEKYVRGVGGISYNRDLFFVHVGVIV